MADQGRDHTWLQRLGRRGVSIAALAPAVPLALSQAAAASPDATPLVWAFDKCAVAPDVWQGTASDSTGATDSVETRLAAARQTGDVLHVDFAWYLGDLFMAELTGTFNLTTGVVVMNGQIADGSYAGSQVHEQGQLYDPANSCFAGTIRVMPASG